MVNDAETDPERALALGYAPAAARAGMEAMFALDGTLAGVVRRNHDPMVAQMRLTWWWEALGRLDAAPAPAQPVLKALAQDVLPAGVTGAALAGLVDGWEALVDPAPMDVERLDAHARGRGATLFRLAGRVTGAGERDPLDEAGRGWALADLARHLSAPAEAYAARGAARPLLAEACGMRWSRAGRALGALAHLARMDLLPHPGPPGAPGRVARLLRHRLTGG
jgi:phytoene synthase